MKEITIKLYSYEELSPEAKEVAQRHYRAELFDGYALQVQMDNRIAELLEEHKIVPVSTADRKYESKYAKLYYSLSHCQGDGVMFEGTFEWKGWTVNVVQSGHYTHSYSKQVEISRDDGKEPSEKVEAQFEKVYQAICKELEKDGYALIDDMNSEEYFVEECNANEWTFEEDGTMRNE